MGDIQIKITNLPQIKRAFALAPNLMRKELNQAIRKIILSIQAGEFKEYQSLGIGIITHGLIDSIRRGVFYSDLRGEVGPNVTGSPGVNYALFVHDGTRYMRSRPFLKNSVQDNQVNTAIYFKDAVQNVLDQIGKAV